MHRYRVHFIIGGVIGQLVGVFGMCLAESLSATLAGYAVFMVSNFGFWRAVDHG